ncbi:RT0821/Lpp0805 family surface protein [Aeromonas caviae]
MPPNRRRVYHDVVVVRPYGHWYGGYGSYYDDNDAWKWLAFTAITLKILDNINEEQQREHEAAQVKATTAPLNDPVTWSNGDASGSVTAVREGTSSSGRYCREFQQTITVGGKKEDAFGTACQKPDGSWEIVSD